MNFPNVTLPYTGKHRSSFPSKRSEYGRATHTSLSNYNLNIADMVNRSRGEYAYTMIDIDNQVSGDVIPNLEERIKQIDGIVTVRVI